MIHVEMWQQNNLLKLNEIIMWNGDVTASCYHAWRLTIRWGIDESIRFVVAVSVQCYRHRNSFRCPSYRSNRKLRASPCRDGSKIVNYESRTNEFYAQLGSLSSHAPPRDIKTQTLIAKLIFPFSYLYRRLQQSNSSKASNDACTASTNHHAKTKHHIPYL